MTCLGIPRRTTMIVKSTIATRIDNPTYHRMPEMAKSAAIITTAGAIAFRGDLLTVQARCQARAAPTKAVIPKQKNVSFKGCEDQMMAAGERLSAVIAIAAGNSESGFEALHRRITIPAPT
jgi:hypothetical protein